MASEELWMESAQCKVSLQSAPSTKVRRIPVFSPRTKDFEMISCDQWSLAKTCCCAYHRKSLLCCYLPTPPCHSDDAHLAGMTSLLSSHQPSDALLVHHRVPVMQLRLLVEESATMAVCMITGMSSQLTMESSIMVTSRSNSPLDPITTTTNPHTRL